MRRLVLVRHSLPTIVPDVPPNKWRLSDEGRPRCKWLAEGLAPYQPDLIVASVEPKASETGRIVADTLSRPFETAENLHEHDTGDGGVFDTTQEFETRVASFFENPQTLILGRETADEAHERFAGAVAGLVGSHPDQNLIVVAHGRVIALFVARAAGLEQFPLWKRLGMPSFVVLSLPKLKLQTLVEEIETRPTSARHGTRL